MGRVPGFLTFMEAEGAQWVTWKGEWTAFEVIGIWYLINANQHSAHNAFFVHPSISANIEFEEGEIYSIGLFVFTIQDIKVKTNK